MKKIDFFALTGKRLILLFAILLFSNRGFSHGINGIVIDQQSQGIQNAKVSLLGTAKYAVTNGLGEFVLTDIHLGDSISIESQGYQKRVFLIDSETYFEKKRTLSIV